MFNIKECRINAKKTQVQLAIELGITQSVISQWEKGVAAPRGDKLPQIARALGCTVDDLYAEEASDQ